MQMFLSEGWV